MSAYVPAIIWVLSAFVCAWIAKVRGVRANTWWAILVALIGPFAIPLVLLVRPGQPQTSGSPH